MLHAYGTAGSSIDLKPQGWWTRSSWYSYRGVAAVTVTANGGAKHSFSSAYPKYHVL